MLAWRALKHRIQSSGGDPRPSRRCNLELLYSNVTSLSKRLMDYFGENRGTFQLLCLAEHKKLQHEIAEAQEKFIGLKCKSWWTQAKCTEANAASGGTSIHLDNCFMAKRLDWANLQKGMHLPNDAVNWTGVIVRGAINFVVVVAYFKHGIGMTGPNIGLAVDIFSWATSTGLPWLVIADWNATPEELLKAQILADNMAIVVPEDCAVTCSMGQGRIIDYVVASDSMSRLITVTTDLAVPITPHVALRVSIDLSPLENQIRVISAPPAPMVPCINKKDHRTMVGIAEDPKEQARKRKLPRKGPWKVPSTTELQMAATSNGPKTQEEEKSEGISWHEAKELAKAYLNCSNTGSTSRGSTQEALRGIQRSAVGGSVAMALTVHDAIEIGEKFSTTITASEYYLASRDPNLRDQLSLAVGRAKGPKYKVRTAKAAMGALGPLDSVSSSLLVRSWGGIAGKMALLAKLKGKQNNQARKQMATIVQKLKKLTWDVSKLAGDSNNLQEVREAKQWMQFANNLENADHEAIQCWLDKARSVHANKTDDYQAEAKKSFTKWLIEQEQNHSMKGIFSWIKKADCQLIGSDVIHNGNVIDDNEGVAEEKAETWEGMWQNLAGKDEEYLDRLLQAWHELKKLSEQEKLPDVTMQDYHEAIYTFKRWTGKGSDNLGPDFLKALPREAKLEIVAIYNMVQQKAAWPWQWLHVIIAMIPKPAGGDRPIGLLQLLVRVFFRIHRKRTREWEAKHHGHWDTAIQNSSALKAAIKRALDIECAKIADETFALILIDIEKFYDTIPLDLLIRMGIKLGYSPTLLALNVTISLAHRTLKTQGGATREVQPFRSIIPGLGEANNLARMVIYDICEAYSMQHASVPLKTFVDDMAQYTQGETFEVATQAMDAAKALATGLQSAGFVVSKKSQLLTNSNKVAHLVKSSLKAINVELQAVNKATDLGLDLVASGKPLNCKRNARVKSAMQRAERADKIRNNRIRQKVTKMAVIPKASFGTEAIGLEPNTAKAIKRKLTSCLGYKQGMCSTTLLALRGEPCSTIANRWKHVKQWIDIWIGVSTKERKKITRAWVAIHADIAKLSSTERWRKVNGPISTMVATLMDIDWIVKLPHRWTTPEDTVWWISDDPMDLNQVKAEFFRLSELGNWAKAARHYLGKGAEKGVIVEPAIKLRRSLKKKGDHRAAGLLDCIVTAGMWSNVRIQEAGYDIDTRCVLCGHETDDDWHRMWQCPAIMCNQDKDIQLSNHLCAQALCRERTIVEGADMHSEYPMAMKQWPCFWLRGLVPKDWLTIDPIPVARTWCNGKLGGERTNVHGRTLYIDESAGKNSAVPHLRRAGWGIVMLDDDGEAVGAAAGTQGGEVQTQIAACLSAIKYVAENTDGEVLLKPDCNYAVNGMDALLDSRHNQFGPHAHVWHDIRVAAKHRIGAINIQRVDAHADVRDYLAQGIDTKDWLGNELADYIAGQAATENECSANMEGDWNFFRDKAMKVLRRAMAVQKIFIEAELATGKSVRGVRPERDHPVHRAIEQSGHQLVKDSRGAFQCLACGQRASRGQLRQWLTSAKCSAVVNVGADGLCAQQEQHTVQIGKKVTHPSHSLCWKRGVWFCTSCGAYAKANCDEKSTCHGLSQPCMHQPTRSGTEVLRRIRKNDTPKCGMRWPLSDYASAVKKASTMEELWPDKRGSKRASYKRRVKFRGDENGIKKGRVEYDDGSPDACMECAEPMIEFELNEDEDPWGDQEDRCEL